MQGLNWQTWPMKFVAGLNQKADPRTLDMPELVRAVDVEFDKLGGLQTRYPFADFAGAGNIFGGGTLANIRRVVENGDELLVFTKDALYSWNAQLSKWVLKGTHLAVKLDETSRFVMTGDQVECDRAELSGTIVYCWSELVGTNTKGYVAAIDKTTGNVLMTPTALAGSASRLRVVALSTKILLSFYDGLGGLYAYALDPASPATAFAGASTTLTNSSFGTFYDIAKIPGADQAVFACRRSPNTSYLVGTVTAGLSVSTSTKARTCDGPIAVSCPPTGTQVQVIRANGTNIQGDLITISGFVDTAHIAKAVGSVSGGTLNQIAAAHRSTQDSGEYRCYAFWSYAENADTSATFGMKSNWVDTSGNLGSQGDFVDHVGVVSRAWDHDGHVYVWVGFAATSAAVDGTAGNVQIAGSLQNTYFMYRDDAFLVAKAAPAVAGGYSYATGHLPGVATTGTNTYAWCGVERRRLEAGGPVAPGYSARAPHDIAIEFDTNAARRCARLGQTLYIACGEGCLQYDGTGIYEVGFHLYPWYFMLEPLGSGGGLSAGSYSYKTTWRWDNARGERERSTTATAGTAATTSNDEVLITPYFALNVTHKTGSTNPPAVEIWRTAVNPRDDAPFFLVTSPDPTATTGDNRYIANDHTAMEVGTLNDVMADSTATTKESNPENGGYLENLAPPAASIIIASDTRLFLAGISGDPDRVWYSKQRSEGEIAAFNDYLTIQIPPDGGEITALAIHNETPVVFRKNALYALDGIGFDNAGGGSNYIARRIPGDVGAVNQESVKRIGRGTMFKSNKGWYVLNHGWQVEYIGGPVADYDSETPLAVDVLEKQHQVRVLTSSRMLVFHTLASDAFGRPTWSEWSLGGGVDACMWRGSHVYVTSSAVKQQLETYTGVDYGFDVELAWLKLGDLQGYGRVRWFEILGEFRSACGLRVRLGRDYWKDGENVYFQDKTYTPALTAGRPLKLRHTPKIQQLESLRVRLTAVPTGGGESLKLSALSFELGFKRGLNKNLPAAQKQ